MHYSTFNSPIGELLLAGGSDGLRLLSMQEAPRPRAISPSWHRDDEAFTPIRTQLEEYFDGIRKRFDVKLALRGAQFELQVWNELLETGYGETISYGALAAKLGTPTAARAVGLANGRNPVAVIVPCHRVIGADGTLTGYGGGLERKRFLLDLESGVLPLLGSAASA